jgi:hypothetical protein
MITTLAWVVFAMLYAPLDGRLFGRLCPERPSISALLLCSIYGFQPSYARYATRHAHNLRQSADHDRKSAQYSFAK